MSAMEGYLSKISSEGETLYSSQMSRLKPSSRTGIFEDLGSSFTAQKPYPKGKKAGSPRKRRSPSLSDFGSDDDSIDELDCLSQQSTRGDTGRKGHSSSQTRPLHSYHPKVLEGRSDVLKKLKFNKKSNATEGGGKKKSSPLRPKPPPKAEEVKEPRYRNDRETESEDEVHEPSQIEKGNSIASSTNSISRPQPKPRPRPKVPHPLSPPGDPSESLFGTPKAPSRTASLSIIPLPSPLSHPKTSGPRQHNESSSTAKLGPSSSSSKSTTSSSHPPPSSSSRCSTRASLSSSKSTPRLLQSFPGVSPLSSPARKCSTVAAGKDFPTLSPLNKSTKNEAPAKAVKKRGKGKRKMSDRILQPFPMSTQDFGGVPPSSDDDSEADGRHARKRRYQEQIDELSDMDLYEEEDSLFMSPAVDPKTLCPYCDEPLPTTPTPFLQRLLQTIYKKSHPDPRFTNPLGRKAPLSIFASVCRRHRFECETLPEAEAKGWPKTIDWENLGARIEKLRGGLREIIDDPGPKTVDVQALEGGKGGGEIGMFMLTNFIGKGPRLQCVFWREAMRAVLLRGTRALNGVRAQFLDFDRSLPGYYGELGSMIIHQTLLNMFPLDSFGPQKIAPFTPNDFIQRILIPEVALQLIIEDRGLKGLIGAETALQVLRDSTAYGAAMFPEDNGEEATVKRMNSNEANDGNDSFGVGIGDKIVMERARKRRKEIEEELEDQRELAMDIKEERKRKRRGREPIPIETASEVDERTLRTSPRRKVSSKQRKKNGIGTDSDAVSMTDGEGTDLGMKTDGSAPGSRPKRNTRRVNYTDHSSDGDDDDLKLEKRGRAKNLESRPTSSSRFRSSSSRQPSPSETSRKAVETKVNFLSQASSLPTNGLGSGDEDQWNSKSKLRTVSESLAKGKPGRKANTGKRDKLGTTADVDMDMDGDTPMPKRRVMESLPGNEDVDLTPRPGMKPDQASLSLKLGLGAHDSVLARARARAQGASDYDHQTKENTASTSDAKKSSKKTEWVSHMRYNPASDDSSDRALSLDSSSSEAEGDNSVRMRRKDRGKGKNKEKETEEHRWLLSDFSSQEGRSLGKRDNSRPAR